MTLQTGAQLGPYEVQALLGAGAMGEVYRARDPRLGREVAVKVLPPSLAADADRLRRFEQEARAAGSLNHPGILVLHDIGRAETGPYIVTELLEGESLRALLGGPLAPARAIDLAVQVARGLAAAHAKGVVHRDVKPENLFVTRDGRIKILDFGLAKLTGPASDSPSLIETLAGGPTEGMALMGTVGYMSPEQARGRPVDHRSDLFSLGIVLIEMLAGAHPFARDSAVETLHAILADEPPRLPDAARTPVLERVLERCLAKRVEERWQGADDLAFVLELAAESARSGGGSSRVSTGRGATVGGAAGLSFRRVTFRRGTVLSARFAPDGRTVLYGAAWDGRPVEAFWNPGGATESRPLELPETEVLSVSRDGELALATRRRHVGGFVEVGTLARMPIGGRAPRELLDDVNWADWGPDGTRLAVIRRAEGMFQVEYPIGKALYRTAGWLSHVRVSPDGERVAFVDHPILADDGGAVMVAGGDGRPRALSAGWESLQGLAWAPDGGEVWFSGARVGAGRSLHAVDLSGGSRPLLHLLGSLTLQDVSARGAALVTQGQERLGIRVDADGRQRDLSWLDWSLLRDLTPDGKMVLFDETGEGGGEGHGVYIRGSDGSPAIRLGDGVAMRLSPDARWVFSLSGADRSLVLLPTGAGEPRLVPTEGLRLHGGAWFPDGRRLALTASGRDRGVRLYTLDIESGAVAAVSEEGVGAFELFVSPDGRFIAAPGSDQTYRLYPVDGGPPRSIPGAAPFERLVGLSADGGSLFLYQRGEVPARVHRVDLATGERSLFREVMPADLTGVRNVGPVRMTADERTVVFTYSVQLHDLYVIEGLGAAR